jgi:hypothetical protein
MSEWISVEERMPYHQMVLAWCDGDYEFALMIGSEMHVYDGKEWVRPGLEITHWQPLPDPPK